MTVVVALVMVAAVAAVIALPFLRVPKQNRIVAVPDVDAERFQHEKNIALTAIKEAELDHAMGKLSDGDYASLRAIYEQRALGAMAGLDGLAAATSAAAVARGPSARATSAKPGAAASDGRRPASFCPTCGTRFGDGHRFCAGCGGERGQIAPRAS